MTTKEAINIHLSTNYISKNNLTYFSGLCGGLKDSRKMTGRNMNTGEKFPDNNMKCSEDENGPCFKGHLGSWLGTMGYMALLDQIGKCYKPKNKIKITDNSSAIKKSLKYFTTLNDLEIDSIYALRNAFFHDYSIFNRHNGNNKFFILDHSHTTPIVQLPLDNWDGNYNNINQNAQTYVNLEAIGDLVENIYKNLLLLALNEELDIELTGGADELVRRYTFMTGVRVK